MDDVVRIGLIGCGRIGWTHMEAIAGIDGMEAVAASNRNTERLNGFADRHRIPRRYADWRDLLADPEVDAIVNCLPEGLHAPVALEAARRGKHQLVEKPMCLSVAECDAMTAAAAAAGTVLMVAQVMRFVGSHIGARQWIEEGRLGRIERVTRRRLMTNALPSLSERPWIGDPALAADWLVYGFGSHEADALLWMLGGQAVGVRASGERITCDSWTGWGSVTAEITLADGVSCELRLGLHETETAWDTVVTGRAGEMIVHHQKLAWNGEETDAPLGDPFRKQMQEFRDAIHARREPRPSGRMVRPTMALLDAIAESLKTSCDVSVPSA